MLNMIRTTSCEETTQISTVPLTFPTPLTAPTTKTFRASSPLWHQTTIILPLKGFTVHPLEITRIRSTPLDSAEEISSKKSARAALTTFDLFSYIVVPIKRRPSEGAQHVFFDTPTDTYTASRTRVLFSTIRVSETFRQTWIPSISYSGC